jgi:hypothetical protein
MAVQYKCPDPDCEATDFAPVPVTSFGDQVPMVVCGRCGKEYPKATVKPVR